MDLDKKFVWVYDSTVYKNRNTSHYAKVPVVGSYFAKVAAMLVKVRDDFGEDIDIYQITASTEIRPKTLFVSSNGVYYKDKAHGRVFLSESERKSLEEWILNESK
jgi:hypothetical protein